MIKKNIKSVVKSILRILFVTDAVHFATSIHSFSLSKEFEIESTILIYHACELVFFSLLMLPSFTALTFQIELFKLRQSGV